MIESERVSEAELGPNYNTNLIKSIIKAAEIY